MGEMHLMSHIRSADSSAKDEVQIWKMQEKFAVVIDISGGIDLWKT